MSSEIGSISPRPRIFYSRVSEYSPEIAKVVILAATFFALHELSKHAPIAVGTGIGLTVCLVRQAANRGHIT